MPPEGAPHPARAAIEAGDVDALAGLLALLRVVASVFEDFRYADEWRDGRTTILFFEARVGDRELQGIDILEEGDEGLIERFTVMVRPLSGLQALSAAVAARTEAE